MSAARTDLWAFRRSVTLEELLASGFPLGPAGNMVRLYVSRTGVFHLSSHRGDVLVPFEEQEIRFLDAYRRDPYPLCEACCLFGYPFPAEVSALRFLEVATSLASLLAGDAGSPRTRSLLHSAHGVLSELVSGEVLVPVHARLAAELLLRVEGMLSIRPPLEDPWYLWVPASGLDLEELGEVPPTLYHELFSALAPEFLSSSRRFLGIVPGHLVSSDRFPMLYFLGPVRSTDTAATREVLTTLCRDSFFERSPSELLAAARLLDA